MKLSESLKQAFATDKETITLREILAKIDSKSFGFLIVLLATPSALPVPAPAYSSPFGILLFIIAIEMLRGKNQPWFPKKFLDKELKVEKNQKLINGISKFVSFFEVFTKPRLKNLFNNKIFLRVLALTIMLASLSMMLPLLLTNTIPAFGCFLIGVGLLQEDTLFAILGIIASLIGVAVTTALLYLLITVGQEAFDIVGSWLSF